MNQRRFTAAVRTNKAVSGSGPDVEADMIEGLRLSERLTEIPHCNGKGHVISLSFSSNLAVLRAVENDRDEQDHANRYNQTV